MLDAGASLLQVYTGFIFRGPALVADLNRSHRSPRRVRRPHDHLVRRAADRGDRRPRPALRRDRSPSRRAARAGGCPRTPAAWNAAPAAWSRRSATESPIFKPQSAFFEAYGRGDRRPGTRLWPTSAAAGALSLLDVKRGDIGSTMDAYAAAYLTDGSPLAADAITLSPYLGFGSLAGAIALARARGAASTCWP